MVVVTKRPAASSRRSYFHEINIDACSPDRIRLQSRWTVTSVTIGANCVSRDSVRTETDDISPPTLASPGEVGRTFATNVATHRLRSASSVALRLLQTVDADGAAAASSAVHNGQARRAMLVEFPAHFFNWLIRATTSRREAHDLFDANFGSAAVISRHAATHVALGDRHLAPLTLRVHTYRGHDKCDEAKGRYQALG